MPPDADGATVVLVAGQVADVAGVPTGCGNIWHREWTEPDGTPRSGLSALLAPFDRDGAVVVGEGTVVAVGDRSFVVVAVEHGGARPANVVLRPVPETPSAVVEAQGIAWAVPEVDAIVERAMRDEPPGNVLRDDRAPVDVLVRAWHELGAHPAVADRLSRAVARFAERGDEHQREWAVTFFDACPTAAGGEVFARLVTDAGLGERPHPLLGAAVAWRGGAAVTSELLGIVEAHVADGTGGELLGAVSALDPAWFASRIDALCTTYPDRTGSLWRGMVRSGADPVQAFDHVLAGADAAGRDSLSAHVRYSLDLDLATTQSLLARL